MSIFDSMKKYFLIPTLLFLVFCSKEKVSKTEIALDSLGVSINSENTPTKDSLTLKEPAQNDIKTLNNEILQLLKTKDYEKFTHYFHPEKGVRFSMYGYVQPKKDKVLAKKISKNILEQTLNLRGAKKMEPEIYFKCHSKITWKNGCL